MLVEQEPTRALKRALWVSLFFACTARQEQAAASPASTGDA
jgi:hypothetical protein